MFPTRFLRGARRARGDSKEGLDSSKDGGGNDTMSDMSERPENLQDQFSRDALSPAFLRAAYDYWCENRKAGGLPPTDAIDPTRLPRECLPHIVILDVEPSPLRFRFRLSGTKVVEGLGVDYTGVYLDEIPGIAEQLERISWCAREGCAYLSESLITFAPNNFKRYQVLGLPFGNGALGVQRIVFVFSFQEIHDDEAG